MKWKLMKIWGYDDIQHDLHVVREQKVIIVPDSPSHIKHNVKSSSRENSNNKKHNPSQQGSQRSSCGRKVEREDKHCMLSEDIMNC